MGGELNDNHDRPFNSCKKIISTRSAVVTINGAIGGGVVGTVYRYMNCYLRSAKAYDRIYLSTRLEIFTDS